FFNHLIAATLAADPIVEGGHRVVFLSSDDEDATAPVAALAKQLGFAPVKLGKLNEGGALMHARGRTWGQLIFQDLFKKEQQSIYDGVIDAENWSSALTSSSSARPNIRRPQSCEGWGGPDGVWAPFEERGDARQSGRSAGRLESIDCYRWPRIRSSVLCYPILLHGTPLHSHSIVLSDLNAL